MENLPNGKEISIVPFGAEKRTKFVPLEVLHNFEMNFPENYYDSL